MSRSRTTRQGRQLLEAHGDPEPRPTEASRAAELQATLRLLATVTVEELLAIARDPATPEDVRALAKQSLVAAATNPYERTR